MGRPMGNVEECYTTAGQLEPISDDGRRSESVFTVDGISQDRWTPPGMIQIHFHYSHVCPISAVSWSLARFPIASRVGPSGELSSPSFNQNPLELLNNLEERKKSRFPL